MEILIVSCDRYSAFWPVWKSCFEHYWPECPYPWRILSNTKTMEGFHVHPMGPEGGWNRDLVKVIRSLKSEFVMIMLEDDFLGPEAGATATKERQDYSKDVARVLSLLQNQKGFGSVALARGTPTDEICKEWDRLGLYDFEHHPFKRCTLTGPRIWRTSFLVRVLDAVIEQTAEDRDLGRLGAIAFEVTGTLLTEDAAKFPERFLGVQRSRRGIFNLLRGVTIREGKLLVLSKKELKQIEATGVKVVSESGESLSIEAKDENAP